MEWVNPAIDWCGARPIQGPGPGRAATAGGLHAMIFAASTWGSEMALVGVCICSCRPFAGVPGVVHTFSGVTIGRVHRSVDGSLYPCSMSLSLK